MASLLCTLAVAAMLARGDPAATLTGVVRDAATGEPLPGAVVALVDLDRAATSGPDGRYLLVAVPAGPQHLQVRRIGYETRTLHALVPAGGVVEIDFSLRPSPVVLPRLEVAPGVAVRGAEPAAEDGHHPDIHLSAAAVRNHPLLAEPDFLAAAAGGTVAVQPEAARGLHVRGGAADQVTYLLDGIPVLSPFHAAGVFSAWNPDALARLRLEPTAPVSAAPDALSGVVSAETRAPGAQLRVHGALSTTQARLTVDGPLPVPGAGFMLSGRRGFPGVPRPEREVSYIRGRGADWLAKVEGRAAGGRIRLLGYGNRNWTDALARPPGAPAEPEDPPRNRFDWEGRSWGGEWVREVDGFGRVRLRGWHASADARARWASEDPGAARLASTRRDAGGSLAYEVGEGAMRTTVGVRAARSRTDYRVGPQDGEAEPAYLVEGETDVAAVFAWHARALGVRAAVEGGIVAGLYAGEPRLAPQLRVRWTPSSTLALSAGASRAYQAEQSLRNAESVVGYVFPPALPAGVGAGGVPLARADQAFAAAELQPVPGVRIAAQAYARDFDGLVLVAPVTAQPFATGGFTVGRGSGYGAALDVAVSGARYALVGSYGWQRVRLAYGDTSYVPDFAAAHTADAGIVVFPQATLSLRLGASGAFGRRTTPLVGPFEWEACNLLDRGCEFAGSPQRRAAPLGSLALPAYLRVDAGARKHWHLRAGGREMLVGVYASVTNVVGRQNLLTASVDPVTGETALIEMTSRVPLVVGMDWRF